MSGLLRRGGVAMVAGVLVAGLIGLIPAVVPPASGATAQVLLGEMRFNPSRLELALGDSVNWEAADDGHTVTAADGSFDSSPRGLMAEGDEYRYRFRVPGTYAYFCRVHANRGMRGEITVVDPYAPTSSTRVMPVTAAAPTPTTAAGTAPLPTEPLPTTTRRPLATSSSTSPAIATSTTAVVGTALMPQEPPPLNPAAPAVGSAEADANLPEAQAAARRTEAEDDQLLAIALVAVVALALFGGFVGVRARRRRPSA